MSKSLPRFAGPMLWGTSQAGGTLLLASSAWMISGLTNSPFLNGLMPAVGALPVLLNLKCNHKGYWIQVFGVGLLLIFSFFYSQDQTAKIVLLLATYFTIFIYGVGQETSMVPIQAGIIVTSGVSMKSIQIGQDIGILSGNLMTAIFFPAVRQFIPALILMLPMAQFLRRSRANLETLELQSKLPKKLDFNRLCLIQGLVLGSLFSMLALWVREIDNGKCFDFAMVLVAYAVGRSLVSFVPKMPASIRYILIILFLILIELIPFPWLSITMFAVIGALVSASDFSLVDGLDSVDDIPSRWQVMQNSSALGGLVGSLILGLICEIIGLDFALICVCVGFAMLAIMTSRNNNIVTFPN